MILRCTQKLLGRLSLPDNLDASQTLTPSPVLGDWYATILFTRPSQLILAVSEKSRLCLLLPARELSTLAPRFRIEVAELLRRIGASEEEIEREVQEMSPLTFASTKVLSDTGTSVNRSVLGSMNDFTRMVKFSLQRREWPLLDLSEQMCETPCGPLQMRSPKEVARELLRGV
jgi:hypothetical protein